MFALQTGWIILLAPTPQAAYDLNIIAVRLGEHPDVRLPVMVVTDGFFTSHQRQSCEIIKDSSAVQNFLGSRKDAFTTVDPRHPITLGPYMNDPDLINNKYQLHRAHEAAAEQFLIIAREFEKLTGRRYSPLLPYKMENADSALFILNSAAETAKDAVDEAKKNGSAVGLIQPILLRPFPLNELKKLTHELKSVVIAERSDTPGSSGGPLSHEVRSALHDDHHCEMASAVRIFGLGGNDFKEQDASDLVQLGIDLAKNPSSHPPFGFIGTKPGAKNKLPPTILPALTSKEVNPGLVQIEIINDSQSKSKIRAKVSDLALLATRPKRIMPGHGACPGCGIFPGLDQFFKGIEGDVVVLYHTGCAMVVTTDYPFSSHRITYLHNLFQNGAPTLSGLVEAFYEKLRREEILAGTDLTFVMITGDGGMDIGMGPTIGTALRNHKMIILEYDNQGYMNTGGQLSYTTPFGRATTTSPVGKGFHHKDTLSIMAATNISYVFSAIEGTSSDLIEKAAKAQWYSKQGLVFGKLLVTCPLNWGTEEKRGLEVLQKAVNSCFFPIYEIENGLTILNVDPDQTGQRIPVAEWLALIGKQNHLLKPENETTLKLFSDEVDKRWRRLKARAEHPLL
jgi:pyruvate ferredoxin oxidoreductase alpha subunit